LYQNSSKRPDQLSIPWAAIMFERVRILGTGPTRLPSIPRLADARAPPDLSHVLSTWRTRRAVRTATGDLGLKENGGRPPGLRGWARTVVPRYEYFLLSVVREGEERVPARPWIPETSPSPQSGRVVSRLPCSQLLRQCGICAGDDTDSHSGLACGG
jgi:hypothetical protein